MYCRRAIDLELVLAELGGTVVAVAVVDSPFYHAGRAAAIIPGYELNVLDTLVRHSFDPCIMDEETGVNILHLLATCGKYSLSFMDRLVRYGADPYATAKMDVGSVRRGRVP